MGLFACKYFNAWRRSQPCGTDDRITACEKQRTRRRQHWYAWLVLLFAAGAAQSENIRIATFAAPLSRDGPGLLLRDIEKGSDPQLIAAIEIINRVAPDILLLTDFDYDLDGLAQSAFSDRLLQPYPFQFALQPNAGMATGLDMDGNGKLGEARDAQGYGRFAGDGGMTILSRYPMATDQVQDFSAMLWKDMAGASLPQTADGPFLTPQVQRHQRLSSTGHWIVPIRLPDSTLLHLMAFSATPPVFDGLEDRNGLRNRDELRLWELVLAGEYGPRPNSFVVLGNANLDPLKGDGLSDAMVAFLANPSLQDPLPDRPTADWGDTGPGMLRVSYVLPDSGWTVADAGIFWPAPGDPTTELLGEGGSTAGPHHLVWVDIHR